MMKNILFPTDFSKNSWKALMYALLLFKESRSHFFLLNVIQPPASVTGEVTFASTKEALEKESREESLSKLNKTLFNIKEKSLDSCHNFTLLSECGSFVDVVRRQVKEKEIDLIVIGAKGISGVEGAVIGSTAFDTITKVKCPVLVVPENTVFKLPEKIIFPTDFNMPYSTKVLDVMVHLANAFRSSICILYVTRNEKEVLSGEQKRNQAFLENYLRKNKHSFHQQVYENLSDGIENFIESRGGDWVAMKAKNLNFFHKILFRPEAEKKRYHTHIPFLVLHE